MVRVKCDRFELLTLLECEGRVWKDFQMGGVTSFGHAAVLDEVSSFSWVLPTPLLPHWALKPRSTNIHSPPQLPRKHRNQRLPFLSNALWVTSPFSQLLYSHMPPSQLLSHHNTDENTCMHTHTLSWGCFLLRQWWWGDKDRANIGS